MTQRSLARRQLLEQATQARQKEATVRGRHRAERKADRRLVRVDVELVRREQQLIEFVHIFALPALFRIRIGALQIELGHLAAVKAHHHEQSERPSTDPSRQATRTNN
jgi:hypothetical protein